MVRPVAHTLHQVSDMTRSRLASVLLVSTALAGACSSEPADDGRNDSFLGGGKYDTAGIFEGGPEARGVLALVNAAGRDLLIDEIGVGEKVADNLINVKIGDDGLMGTQDDVLFGTLAQLDAVPFVGAKAFTALLDYARAHGFVPGGGVPDAGVGPVDGGSDPNAPAADQPCGADQDSDGDGTVDQRWRYTYDGAGNSLEDRALDGNNVIVEKELSEYNADGKITRWVWEFEGKPTYLITYAYDSSGRLLTMTEDTDGDGTSDKVTTTKTFDDNGRAILQEQTDKAGKKTRITSTRGPSGKLLREEKDIGDDGTVDRVRVCEYQNDDRDRTCTTTVTGNATPESVVATTFRSDWQILHVRYERRGALAQEDFYTYDADGRMLTYVVALGDMRDTTTYSYTCH